MQLPVYLDHHATTPVDARVLERMLPFFCESFGNASSRGHSFGWKAEEAVEAARKQVAQLLGASPAEIIFTSGATESNNLALFGVVQAYATKGNHIVTQRTEHKAVLDVCQVLEKRGVAVTYLPVDKQGRVSAEQVAKALTPQTIVVSIMHANNEVGTVQPLAEISAVCRSASVLFHTDAAQSAGKLPLDVQAMGLDLVSLSAHKLYGPKGVGALYVRRKDPRVTLSPMFFGGGHERGLRSGTLNVPGIVGLGAAAALCQELRQQESSRTIELRERLRERLLAELDGVFVNGHPTQRLPGNLHVSFAGVEGEMLLLSLRDIAVSSGSACTSATLEPSHVLQAMGIAAELAHSSIRFGIGRKNTEQEIDFAASLVIEKVKGLHRAGASLSNQNAARKASAMNSHRKLSS